MMVKEMKEIKVWAHRHIRNAMLFGSFILANIFSILWRFLYNLSSKGYCTFAFIFGGIYNFIPLFLNFQALHAAPLTHRPSAIKPDRGKEHTKFKATLLSLTSPPVIRKLKGTPSSLHKRCNFVVFPPLLVPISLSFSLQAQLEAVRCAFK